MKELLVTLFFFCLLQSCQQGQSSSAAETATTQAPPVTATVTDPVPVEASTFDTKITTEGLSAEQEEQVQKASEIIKLVVASEEFRDRVLNHTVNGKKMFLNNNGLSNEEIYQKILNAAESDNATADNVMELAISLVKQPKSLGIGSLFFQIISGIKKVFAFVSMFQSLTPAGIAQNLFQMWLGKLGFTLPSTGTTSLSVQGAISKIIGELGQKYL